METPAEISIIREIGDGRATETYLPEPLTVLMVQSMIK
jgi:hypothetical protein